MGVVDAFLSLFGSVEETIPRTANDPPAALVGHGIETPTPAPARLTLSTMFLAKAFIQFKRLRMRQGLTRLHDSHFAKLGRRCARRREHAWSLPDSPPSLSCRVETRLAQKHKPIARAPESLSSVGNYKRMGFVLRSSLVGTGSSLSLSSTKSRPLPVPRMPSSRPQSQISCPQVSAVSRLICVLDIHVGYTCLNRGQHLRLWSTSSGARPGLWDASCMRQQTGEVCRPSDRPASPSLVHPGSSHLLPKASPSELSVRKHTYGVAFHLPPAAVLDPTGASCSFTVVVPAGCL